MDYILGIDQGSSQTRAVLSDLQGRLLAYAVSGGANHPFTGIERAMTVISRAAQGAIDQAGITRERIKLLYAGMTGADWPDEYEMLRGHILELGISPEVIVKNDSIIALRGGTEQSYGAILIAGSGANCAVRAPDGREYIYGYYHDDDLQGAAALGRRTLRAVYRAETGRESATALTQMALDTFGLSCVDDLLRADTSDRLPWTEVRRLAPQLFKVANTGDVVAGQILRSFGEGMAELVVAGLKRFEMTGLELEVVLSGSVFKGEGPLLLDTLAMHIHSVAPHASLVNARYEPVVGAVLLGLEYKGVKADEVIKRNVEAGAVRLGLIRLGESEM